MSNSAQKDNKVGVAKTEASKSRAAVRTPPGAMLPQMAPPPELVALQRVMQGHIQTELPVQRKEAETSTNETGLPNGLKAGVEHLSGVSLDDVRVHYNSDKPAQVGALAYTQGTEIHVAPGKESSVPHEAWHAVQQLQDRVKPNVQFKGKVPGNDEAGLEDEADRMGVKALELSQQELAPTGSLSRGTTGVSVVQRDGDDDDAPAPEAQAKDEEQVDVSAVKSEQRETIEELYAALRKVSAADFTEAITKQEDESTQLWALKFRSDDTEFMKIILDTDWGFKLADKLIRSPKNPVPNYLSLINHVNLGAFIPTKLGEAIQMLVVTLPHAIISGVLNAIPALVGHFMNSNVFFARAIAARYDMEIDASAWTSEEMRNIWNSFKLVPRGHVKGPVRGIKRTPYSQGMLSSFGDGSKIILSKFLLQSVSMGGAENAQRPFSKFLMKRSIYSQRMRSKNAFSMTTLHEVGHAVDGKLAIMRNHGETAQFGNWVSTTPNEIFTKWWSGAPDATQIAYSPQTRQLQQALSTAQAEYLRASEAYEPRNRATHGPRRAAENARDAAKTRSNAATQRDDDVYWESKVNIPRSLYDTLGDKLAEGKSVKEIVEAFVPLPTQNADAAQARRAALITAIDALPPTRMVKHGRMGMMGMGWHVERGKGYRLSKEFKGRMFHEAYSKVWVGYDIAAKEHGVSHYQFRAPGEFFAELYAHYYLDTLISKDKVHKHPLYSFIEEHVARKTELMPQKMVEQGEVVPSGSNLVEGGILVPVPQASVALEQGDEQAAPEQVPLDQQPAPTVTNQELPKEQGSV